MQKQQTQKKSPCQSVMEGTFLRFPIHHPDQFRNFSSRIEDQCSMPVFRGPLPGQKKIPESLLHQFPESGFPENDIVNFQERRFNRIGGQILAGGKNSFPGISG